MTDSEMNAVEKRLSKRSLESPWNEQMYHEAKLLELIQEFRQMKAERDWLASQRYPQSSTDTSGCPNLERHSKCDNVGSLGVYSHKKCRECWLKAAKERKLKKGGLITMTIIIKCDCKSEYQDKTYGNRNRVANTCASKNNEKCRCTVCGKEHSMTSSTIVKKNS